MSKKRLSPHDRFTRAMMTNKKVIREFFDLHLPEKIKKMVDFSTLEPQKESFIDDKLRLNIADLLYQVKIEGQDSYFYVLLEHQSSSDKLMPYRLIKYMIGIIDHHLKKNGGSRLPFIFPIVLYTGEKPYRYSMDLFDLFEDHKELARDTWIRAFHLVDLTQVSDEELKKYSWFGTMALMLKHVHDPDILPLFKSQLQILRKIEKEGESEYLYTILSYVVEAAEVSSKEEFLQTIKQLESLNEEKVMTIAEQFRQEGKAERNIEIALSMLQGGIPLETISKHTHLSAPELEALKKKIH